MGGRNAGSTVEMKAELVVVLHGMCRTSRSMAKMARALERAGYTVLNLDYPSRTAPIEALADLAIGQAMTAGRELNLRRIHFVTHSLGGILVRSYFARHPCSELGRVVMLGPPNQGSEVVDRLGRLWLFAALNGPAGRELGTDPASTPNRLGPVGFSTGIIAGDRSINWINSLMIRGPDDGKVSVERTKVEGMSAHCVVHAAHPWLMNDTVAVRQTLHFLRHGSFE